MKGVVFREFLDLVEDKFGVNMADSILTESNRKRTTKPIFAPCF